MGGVLDHGEVVAAREVPDRVEVGRHSGDVDRHDGRRPTEAVDQCRVEASLEVLDVEVERDRVDVAQHRRRAEVVHDLGGGGERVGRHEHQVTGADAHGLQAQVQRRRRRS